MSIFKENDWVYHYIYGKGKVIAALNEVLTVRFVGGNRQFLYDGSERFNTPTLSFTPYDLINGGFSQERPKPEIEKGTVIYVKTKAGSWQVMYFVDYGPKFGFEDGVVASQYKEQDKPEFGLVGLYFKDYSLENPLL